MVSKDPNKRLGGLHFAVFYGERLEKTVTLAQDCIFIGRLLTSHLPVEDSKVSRMHAVIEIRDGNEVIVSDLESSNGTREVKRRPIKMQSCAKVTVFSNRSP
jgi:pSer/pThr/pTyr-binding forkhead associated (FHA) protein